MKIICAGKIVAGVLVWCEGYDSCGYGGFKNANGVPNSNFFDDDHFVTYYQDNNPA